MRRMELQKLLQFAGVVLLFMALWAAQCYKWSYDKWMTFWKLSCSLCHIAEALNCHWFPIGFWCHRNAHERSVLAVVGENKGNGVIPVLYTGSWGTEGQANFYSVLLGFFSSYFWGRGVYFFKPGQFFNKLFILFSIFDAFTVTMSPSHQQPSLAVTNLPKFSEEVNGRAGNWTLLICNDSQCTPLDRE